MIEHASFKFFGLLIFLLLVAFVISVYKRPSREYFEASMAVSMLENQAKNDAKYAEKCQDKAGVAIEKCKELGIQLPEHFTSAMDPALGGGKSAFTDSLLSIFNKSDKPLLLKFTAGLRGTDVKQSVKDILQMKLPSGLSPTEQKKAILAKLDIAKAIATETQATASQMRAETARQQLETREEVINNISVPPEVKEDPKVQEATKKADEAAKEAETLLQEAAAKSEKVTEVASDPKADPIVVAEAQKVADESLAKAAVAAEEAAKAKLDVTTAISEVDTRPEAQEQIKATLEVDKKAVEAASALTTAAEIKAEVSKAEALITTTESQIAEIATEAAKAPLVQDKLDAEEELRKKITESEFAAAEAQKRKAEEDLKRMELEEKMRKEAEETRIYATNAFNNLYQNGLAQVYDDTYNAILAAKNKGEVDALAEQARNAALAKRKRDAELEQRIQDRVRALIEAQQGRAILTPDEQKTLLELTDQAIFDQKAAELRASTTARIQAEQAKRQAEIDELNRISNEKSQARLRELMAMTPEARAQSQADEARQNEINLRNSSQQNFEAYKKRILANLVNVERILSAETAANLMNLPSYEEFDKQLRIERMKKENTVQKVKRETDEANFQSYKENDINSMLKNDLIYTDTDTLSKLRNATNYDQFSDLSNIEMYRKKQETLKQQASAQSMALFAQNMEPTRVQLVDTAFRDGWINQEQYDRLKIISINTPEKFQALQDELKKSRADIIAAREAETKRKLEAAAAEQRAREEAEKERLAEQRRQVIAAFNERRPAEVENLMIGMFPITEAQKQDLLTTDYDSYNTKKEQYILQAYGGSGPKPGESLADFFNRRQNEVLQERALAEQRKKDEEQKAATIAQLFQRNQDMVNSTNRFWKAEGEANLKILNALKARNLSNTDFLKAWQDATMSNAERAQREAERKFDETQQRKFTVKDKDGNDIVFYRLFKYSMPARYRIGNSTAEECANDLGSNPNVVGFLRDNNVKNEDKANCWVNDNTDMRFAKVSDFGTLNIYVRNDQLPKVVGADAILGPTEMAAAAALTELNAKKRAEAETKRKEEENKAKRKELMERSQLLTIGGKQFRVFKNSTMPRGGVQNTVQIGAAIQKTLDETVGNMNSLGGKSFGRITFGRRWNDDGTAIIEMRDALELPRTNGHIFKSSDPYLIQKNSDVYNGDDQYAVYIPVENLPPEFQETSAFTDYSRGRTNVKKSIVNQGAYLDRSQRALNYTMFHPAL